MTETKAESLEVPQAAQEALSEWTNGFDMHAEPTVRAIAAPVVAAEFRRIAGRADKIASSPDYSLETRQVMVAFGDAMRDHADDLDGGNHG